MRGCPTWPRAPRPFAAFGVVTELEGRTAIGDYRGRANRRPLLAVALGLALPSFVGIPPLGGFTGKPLLFTAAIDGGYAWLAAVAVAVAVANMVVSLFYYLRIVAPDGAGRERRPGTGGRRWARRRPPRWCSSSAWAPSPSSAPRPTPDCSPDLATGRPPPPPLIHPPRAWRAGPWRVDQAPDQETVSFWTIPSSTCGGPPPRLFMKHSRA